MSDIFSQVLQLIQPVYQVGGSVRDELLGITPTDHDFATSLKPNEIEQKIRQAGRHPYTVGKRFGTIGVKIDGRMAEITTFRQEWYEGVSRKPRVEFVNSIDEDLARRDFTINALAKTIDGTIIDPFGGQGDLDKRLIRAVGNPSDRFQEDPLRMLRAARFAAQFGFSVEPKTVQAIEKLVYRIYTVSHERWSQELDKLLVTNHVRLGLNTLAQTRLLNFILPHLSLQVGYDQRSPYHQHTLWEHTIHVVESTPPDKITRWAALLHDIGKPYVAKKKPHSDQCNYIHHEQISAELTKEIAQTLRWSNDRRDAVVSLVANHMQPNSPLRPYDDEAH